jgi:RNA recognition motif-containing protein
VKNLYVGNLPFQATEDDLRDWFANAGVTTSMVQIIRDKFSGSSRGFGFAEIQDDSEGDRAVEMLNGKEFQGRALVVNEARPKREGGGGGFGRGGGGGRGRNW